MSDHRTIDVVTIAYVRVVMLVVKRGSAWCFFYTLGLLKWENPVFRIFRSITCFSYLLVISLDHYNRMEVRKAGDSSN